MSRAAGWRDLTIAHREWAVRISRARAHRLPGMDPDDAAGEAMVALVATAKRFRPASGVAFRTYAATRILGAVTDLHRNTIPSRRRNREDPKAIMMTQVYGDAESLDNENKLRVVRQPTQEASAQLRLVADRLLSLPPRIADAARRHWFGDESLIDVGRALGVGESRACYMVREARRHCAAPVKDGCQ